MDDFGNREFLPNFKGSNVSRFDDFRHWLIRQIARGDAMVLNLEMWCPEGWKVASRSLDSKGYVCNCTFMADDDCRPPVPNTVIMERCSAS